MTISNIIKTKSNLILIIFYEFFALIFFNYFFIDDSILSIYITIFWIISSYLMGRYHNILDKGKSNFLILIKTFLLSLKIYIIILLFNSSKFFNTVNGIKYFAYLFFFIYIFGNLLRKLNNKRKLNFNWVVSDKKIFYKIIKDSGIRFSELKNHNFINLRDYKSKNNKSNKIIDGLIFNDITFDKALKGDDIKEEITFIKTIDWIEKYINRLPVDVLVKEKQYKKYFHNNKNQFTYKIKSLLERLFSFFILIISFPLMLITSFLIFIEDKGPILYKQKRTGINGKIIHIYKLRSMHINAEKEGIKWSTFDDARITKIGRFIRATRIDELPQLVSVIKGDMSLIGPRPERPEYDKQLEKEIPLYKLRYLIKPGISGWAQVNYPYGASIEDAKNKLSYDLFYIKNKSIILEILILIKTIKLVFNRQGAIPISR